MEMENKELQEGTEKIKAKYVAHVTRDEKLLKIFVKFSNKVKHPRTTTYMVLVGGTLTALPIVNKEIALAGVIICYVMGPLMVLMGLFRHWIGVNMLKSNPSTVLGEELTYIFGNTTVYMEKAGEMERMGSYHAIYRLWEDEKHFYIGMNEDDLLVLPKEAIEAEDLREFRDFVLEKSGCMYTWRPARLDNVVKNVVIALNAKFTYKPPKEEEK